MRHRASDHHQHLATTRDQPDRQCAGAEITGNAGENTLKDGGGAGDRAAHGLGGNDTYLVYSAATTIVEVSGARHRRPCARQCRLYRSIPTRMSSTWRRRTAPARRRIDLTGNAIGQQITGNAGDNRIDGKGGSDALFGLGGEDTFVFSTALGAGNVDTIADFNVADDRMLLLNAVFTALPTGVLAAAAFRINTSGIANDASDRASSMRATPETVLRCRWSRVRVAAPFARHDRYWP